MNLCSIFVGIIIGSVTLPENVTVISAVPAGTHIKLIVLMLFIMLLKDVYCICLAVCVFLHRILFCLVRMVLLAAGSPLTSPRT